MSGRHSTRKTIQEQSTKVCTILGKSKRDESEIYTALVQSDNTSAILVQVLSELVQRIETLEKQLHGRQLQDKHLPQTEQTKNIEDISQENQSMRKDMHKMHERNSVLSHHNVSLAKENKDVERHNLSLIDDNTNMYSDLKGMHARNESMGNDLVQLQHKMNSIVQKYDPKLKSSNPSSDDDRMSEESPLYDKSWSSDSTSF
jgi:DNA repair exonuclease SbcCD ATPase subunit